MRRQIVITKPDMLRLAQLVESRLQQVDGIEELEHELDRAIVVDPENISPRIVTMNSRVRVHELDRDTERVVTVVFPFEANAEQNRVSVLAPLGRALLGARTGAIVRFEAPGGTRRVKILGIEYQPEARVRQAAPAAEWQDSRTAA